MNRYPAICCLIVFLCVLVFCSHWALAAETVSEPAKAAISNEVSSQELRNYLQLEEQIQATRLAIERNHKEADTAAAQAANALANRLKSIEQSLLSQRASELQAMQSSNKVMLVVAGSFAAIGFVAMLLMAYFQWRTVNRLAEISAALPNAALALGPGRQMAALGTGAAHVVTVGPVEQSNLRMPLNEGQPAKNDLESAIPQSSSEPSNGSPAPWPPSSEAAHIRMLLGKGQSLLNLDQAEAALACFDEILKLDAGNTEALVKKGTALENLRKLDEAIECYDRAIAADDSMTIAYLSKAGLLNRMERFSEALECYERALRTQEKARV